LKSCVELEDKLNKIDGRGYKAYEDIRGEYEFQNYVLSVDHVQGDPFAPPSKVRITVNQSDAGFPFELYDSECKRVAVVDFLTRLFGRNIKKYHSKIYGTGKSGLILIDSCGQEILDRTSIVIDKKKVEARFEVGLPASGRTIMGRCANTIFFETLPKIVSETLFFKNIDHSLMEKQVKLSVDQKFLRDAIVKEGLVAFVANGAILPRESGISSKPMMDAVPFMSPETMEIEFKLPYHGNIRGMGIPKGITLIVGGGYHGKSTFLRALEVGVYNHIEGDGREFVVTVDDAVKIRSEDGRRVEKVNISNFINNLPNKQDTTRFSTDNASGSTSQAANIMEALEIGTKLLLIDEDTCATNFMLRDEKMQRLVEREKEPITPFIDRVRELYKQSEVSTILVAGSSGDYFSVADRVIMMEEYKAKDVTSHAFEIAGSDRLRFQNDNKTFGSIKDRVVQKSSFPMSKRGIKIREHGIHSISYDHSEIDLKSLEQLVDPGQTAGIAAIMEYIIKNEVDGISSLKNIIDRVMDLIYREGLDSIVRNFRGGNIAKPRKHEIAGAINRFRFLDIK
jgi:predicted ABC-class ATPase